MARSIPALRGLALDARKPGSTALLSGVKRTTALLAFFVAHGFSQGLQLLLVDLDRARFFHLLPKAGDKQAEEFALLLLHQRVANLILLLRVVPLRWLLFVEDMQNQTGTIVIDRSTDVPRL